MSVSAVAASFSPLGLQASSSKKIDASSFGTYLDKTIANLTAQVNTAIQSAAAPSTDSVDSEDERSAIAELLRLYKMLAMGKIDVSALNNSDTNPEVANGPNRQMLERLKTVLRRILGIQGSENNDNMEDFSLKDLIDTLPVGIRDLLRKNFDNLDELMQKDEEYRKIRANQT